LGEALHNDGCSKQHQEQNSFGFHSLVGFFGFGYLDILFFETFSFLGNT
jgi:hypothetical protein